jgi:hypothetical protein
MKRRRHRVSSGIFSRDFFVLMRPRNIGLWAAEPRSL